MSPIVGPCLSRSKFRDSEKSQLRQYVVRLAVLATILSASSGTNAQVAGLMSDARTKVQIVKQVNGQVWLGTKRGVYVLEGEKFRLMSEADLYVNELLGFNGALFVASTRGAYLLDGKTFRRITNSNINVSNMKEAGGATWLLTDEGAFVIDREIPIRVSASNVAAMDVHEVDGKLWLLTGEGICEVIHRSPRCISIEVRSSPLETTILAAQDVSKIKSQLFVATNEGLYRLEGSNPRFVGFKELDILQIKEINGQMWIRTSLGAYRIEGNSLRRIPDIETEVHEIAEVNGQVWLATDSGAYRVDANTARRIPDVDTNINAITEIKDQIWIASESGAYRLNKDSAERIPDVDLSVNSVDLIGDHVWLATDKGAFLVDENQTITLDIKPADSSWISTIRYILPSNTWLSGLVLPEPKYTSNGGPIPLGKQQFEVIWETDDSRFEANLADKRYNATESAFLSLSSGWHTIKYSVRDKWGNTFKGNLSVVVVPGPAATTVILVAFWICFLLIAFAFAPVSSPCHTMLMNPWFRKLGSLGVVPLIITAVPAVRRHVLLRYVKSLRNDSNLNAWRDRFVVPSDDLLAQRFGALLLKRRTVLIVGQSGIGKTSYFRYLASCYASANRKQLLPGNLTPVIIHLSRYEGMSIEDMFDAELANSGGMTDKPLNRWFLQQGGFVIFIDGVNEVPDATRQNVSRFVNQYWKTNLICLSSQQKYAEFDWMEALELTYLTSDKIKEVLALRVGTERAEIALSQFTGDMYDVYKIPQDLEFAAELLKSGQPLPKSKSEIYKATLKPLFDKWGSLGQTAYTTLLFKRAFEMLCSSEAAFERAGIDLPHEIRENLTERKLLIRRGDHYHFTHDLVRAFLAAQHFEPRWESTLKDQDLTVDYNWRAMLEFAILEVGEPSQVGRILFLTLERNVRLAGELFKWLDTLRPDLCFSWAEKFKLKYGEALLQY